MASKLNISKCIVSKLKIFYIYIVEDCNCNVGTSKVGTTLDSFDCERLTGSPSLLLDVSSRKGPPYSSVDRFAASREASSSMTPLIPSATMSSLSSANLHVASPILGSSSTNTVQRAFLQATTSVSLKVVSNCSKLQIPPQRYPCFLPLPCFLIVGGEYPIKGRIS